MVRSLEFTVNARSYLLNDNLRNKTLNGGRAERNEYILLHEFHRLKFICPDKLYGKKAATAAKVEKEGEEGEGGKSTKGKKDKYKGGLVFEPKRGLWDKYILVMDFNSLYPSIIQEYNIDFTTVEPVEDEVSASLQAAQNGADYRRRMARRRFPSHPARVLNKVSSPASSPRLSSVVERSRV